LYNNYYLEAKIRDLKALIIKTKAKAKRAVGYIKHRDVLTLLNSTELSKVKMSLCFKNSMHHFVLALVFIIKILFLLSVPLQVCFTGLE